MEGYSLDRVVYVILRQGVNGRNYSLDRVVYVGLRQGVNGRL